MRRCYRRANGRVADFHQMHKLKPFEGNPPVDTLWHACTVDIFRDALYQQGLINCDVYISIMLPIEESRAFMPDLGKGVSAVFPTGTSIGHESDCPRVVRLQLPGLQAGGLY